MKTEEDIVREYAEKAALEIQAQRATDTATREREAYSAELETVSTQLKPLLKSPTINAAQIKELEARQKVLIGEVNARTVNTKPLHQVQSPQVVKGEGWGR